MGQKNRVVVSDFSFIELASAVQKAEVQAGLTQISGAAIFSFHIGHGGLDGLARKKYVLLHKLLGNRRKLSEYLVETNPPKNGVMAAVLWSEVRTLGIQIGMVKEHIERAIQLTQYQQEMIEYDVELKEIVEDEIPF